MKLEERQVLLKSRLNIPYLINHWKDKEWWYTGVYDPNLKVYFSFYFVRVNFSDQFCFTLFDPANGKPVQFLKNLYMEKHQEKDKLCLNYHSKDMTIEYNGDEKTEWKMRFKRKGYDVQFEMKPTIPYFTKFDNNFEYNYGLMHFFQNTVSGTVKVSGKTYKVTNALSYYDHCFGRVPLKTGWHWIAVQNEDTAIASLINYGPYGQKYTEIYFKKNDKNYGLDKWHRLYQDVSFEYNEETKLTSNWKITSPDMDLTVTPILHALDITKIPPIIPFIANLYHDEYYVKISGSVRIDGTWIEVKEMHGVMEEHHGKW